MTIKQKSVDRTAIFKTLLVVVGPVAVAFFASPWIVEYIKKSSNPGDQSAVVISPSPASATIVPASSSLSIIQEQCLKDAWDAYNSKRYESAIKFANECIDNFGKAAERVQENLKADNEPDPPTGKVSNSEKEKIFNRGVLNDVGTAYFIKGRSAEYLYQKDGNNSSSYKEMAKEAYETACRYKHARTWDTKGWFWSPCQASLDRLPLRQER